MKVCMVVGTDMSHDARVWKEARTLAQAGHTVVVLASWNPELPPEESKDNVRVIRMSPEKRSAGEPAGGNVQRGNPSSRPSPSPGRPKPFKRLRAMLWNLRVQWAHVSWIRSWRPDVLHIHDSDRLFIGLIARLGHRAVIVYDAHEYVRGLIINKSLSWKFTRRFHMVLERYACRKAAAVITVSPDIGEKLRQHYRIAELVILHNYPLFQKPSAPAGLLRQKLAPEHRDRPLLLYQGRLTEFRGFEPFLDALALLPEAAGVVLGSGPLEGRLREQAGALSLGDRVLFVPQVPWDELLAYTADADLGFTISQNSGESLYMALPNKLFEYLMVGVPVVASDFPVLRKYVEEQHVGIVVPPDDPQEIARLVRPLLTQPAVLAEMRKVARRLGESTYNWEAQAPVLTGLYDRLAMRRQSAERSH